MLGIGEFANLTGLTVKALHHHDETGLLEPALTGAVPRYRFHAPGRVRTGTVVRVLRDAGLPLRQVAEALEGDPVEVLRERREAVLAQREREDQLHAAAVESLVNPGSPVEVVQRDAPPQPYVGRVLAVHGGDDTGVEETDTGVNSAFTELHRALVAEGAGPSGPFWTALRAGSAADTVEAVVTVTP
ncbi:MerR family transcriptional regulator [Thermobifida halotolerans]|uniref:MerR family transcriptional regulator n=1 Tax=Thermobifida halotolerans TaxID=483545 RepID=A0AA97LZB6_9ACTN|nr:MerR family transcriptional regulator [Thermobifida halotolerans]UOE20761.1 MerR family transcriptional regulator [Thermobifida halotolerans]